MYPPVSIGQPRVCTSHDTIVGGHLYLPAGTFVAMPHHTIQNASFNWDDHDKFLPGEAWVAGQASIKIIQPEDKFYSFSSRAGYVCISPGLCL